MWGRAIPPSYSLLVTAYPFVLTEEASTRPPTAPLLRLPKSRRRLTGAVGSLLLHLLILWLLVPTMDRDLVRTVPRGAPASRPGGGGGGGGGGYITLPAFEPPPSAATRAPPPRITPPVVVQIPVPQPVPTPPADTAVNPPLVATGTAAAADSAAGPGEGGGTGGGNGVGDGPGTGTGTGPGTGGGEGGTGTGPQLRHLLVAPDNPPKELRGLTIQVTFWIGADGRSERIEVEPEIKDKGFARKLSERMLAYLWRPARGSDGLPVPSTFTLSWTY